MVCENMTVNETPEERARNIDAALRDLASSLDNRTVEVVIGPNGEIAFKNWSGARRSGLTDSCAYRLMQTKHGFALQRAIAAAEMSSGRKVNAAAIASGSHSHDGGQTWHPGH